MLSKAAGAAHSTTTSQLAASCSLETTANAAWSECQYHEVYIHGLNTGEQRVAESRGRIARYVELHSQQQQQHAVVMHSGHGGGGARSTRRW